MSVASSTGTRPIFMYVIAVDADGTREEQKNLSSIASFEFVNSDGEAFNYSSSFTEFEETSFQYYNFALPVLEENAGGNYTLTLRKFYVISVYLILMQLHNYIYRYVVAVIIT